MPTELTVYIIDFAVAAILGIRESKEMKKSFPMAIGAGAGAPLLIFVITMLVNFEDARALAMPSLIIFLWGWLIGTITAYASAQFGDAIKKKFSKSKFSHTG